jgi:hypothetical protein
VPGLVGEPGEVTVIALDGRPGHEGPALASRNASDEAPTLEVGQCLAQGQAVHAEPPRQLTFGGEAVAAVERSARHGTFDGGGDLGV